MKILHLIDSLGYGGAETLMMSYIPKLDDYDHVIVTFSGTNLFPQITNKFSYYNLEGNARRNPFALVRKLKKIIEKEDVSIVHSHSYWTNIISRLATPKTKKLINHYHFADFDTLLDNYKVKLQLKIDKIIRHRNLKRVAVSEYVYTILQKHFYKGKNACLPNFVNVENTTAIKPRSYSKGTPLKIVAVGNLKKEKGYDLLVDAFEKLRPFPIQMDVFGEGEDLERYTGELKNKQITALKFCGRVKSAPEILQQYSLYCSSSTSETFGIALVEAVSAGLPILVSDIPAFREVAPRSARFFEKANIDDFVSQVLDIYKNGIEVSEVEYESVLNRYSPPTFLKNLRKVYKD